MFASSQHALLALFITGVRSMHLVTGKLGDGPVPNDAIEIEVYHVNQANYSGISNMNTADAAGDAFFDLRSLSQYWQCTLNKSSTPFYPVILCDSDTIETS